MVDIMLEHMDTKNFEEKMSSNVTKLFTNQTTNILFYKRRGVHELSMNHSEAEPPKVHTDSIDMLISYSLPQLGDGY